VDSPNPHLQIYAAQVVKSYSGWNRAPMLLSLPAFSITSIRHLLDEALKLPMPFFNETLDDLTMDLYTSHLLTL
jgi:hypothetical protein